VRPLRARARRVPADLRATLSWAIAGGTARSDAALTACPARLRRHRRRARARSPALEPAAYFGRLVHRSSPLGVPLAGPA
jgi:hypothetical protein